MLKGDLDQFADRVFFAGPNHGVVRAPAAHQPHRTCIRARKAAIAVRIEVAERHGIGEPWLDPRNTVGHPVRDEFQPTPRRFVVELNRVIRPRCTASAKLTWVSMPSYDDERASR